MNCVVFKWKVGRAKRQLTVPYAEARDVAIHLSEELLLDKITCLSYTTIINGEIVTNEIDYFNDIL